MNIKELEKELATMKIMIYSLHNAVDEIVKSLSVNGKGIEELGSWEKECEKCAKLMLKENNNE